MDIVVSVDNTQQILNTIASKTEAALEACGNQAVSYAKSIITEESRVDTGALRNSITHQVKGDTCYVGTNIEYAIYHEIGTGIYLEGGGGRQTPWVWVDDKGVGHWTHGIKPIHFLKNAVDNHKIKYYKIIQQYLNS